MPYTDLKQPSIDEKAHSTSNSFDEKAEQHDKIETVGGVLIDTDEIGNVFDSPRLIDLGEDGKERPISKYYQLPRAPSADTVSQLKLPVPTMLSVSSPSKMIPPFVFSLSECGSSV